MENTIKCTKCRFVRVDKSACESGWTAYECGNKKSEYCRALLNVTPNGEKQVRVTWGGCEEGRMRT